MNSKTIGLILIVAGVLMIIYTGFNFVTTEKVVDIGPIEINKDKNHFIQWSPVIGIILLVGGLLITFLRKKGT
ncbi:MAG: hypothetical protein IPL08_15015 [Saprospiraceae bacterium]|nr:hypothetical protein [Saprospiraceae bacterium]